MQTGTTSQTLEIILDGGCAHSLTVPLGCESHDYKHIWGWTCKHCWMQVFYSDLELACGTEI